MWLQSIEETAEHTKDNDDWEAIIIEKLKSQLRRLSYKREDKGKKKGILDPFKEIQIRDFWAERNKVTGSWG